MSKQPVRKVALLTSTFLPAHGGVEVGLHNIALRLQRRGIQPVVIAPFSSRKAHSDFGLTYKVVTLPPRFFKLFDYLPVFLADAVYTTAFALLQRWHHFDFWHVTMGYPAGVAFMPAARLMGARYLIRCAGNDIQVADGIGYGDRLNPRVDRIVAQRLSTCSKLVSISASVRSEYKSIGVPDSHIIDIPNGVDTARFEKLKVDATKVRERLGLVAGTKILLAVGRNHPKKNFQLLPAVARTLLHAGRDDFCFVLAGKDTSKLVDSLPQLERGHFRAIDAPGDAATEGALQLPADDLVALYKASDLFVFPSLIETFGIVIVEAMAAALPVVTTDAPGCRDLVQDGVNGFTCPVNDAPAMAAAILALLKDEGLYHRFAAANLGKSKSFDWDTVVDKYLATYEGSEGSR